MILRRVQVLQSNLARVYPKPVTLPVLPVTARRIQTGPAYKRASGSIFAAPAPSLVYGINTNSVGRVPTTAPLLSAKPQTHKGTLHPTAPLVAKRTRLPILQNNARQIGTLKNVAIVPPPQPLIGTVMRRLRG